MMDMMISQFHFLRPWAWLCLILLFFIIYLMKKGMKGASAWQKVCAPELFAYLQVDEMSGRKRDTSMWLLAIAGLLAITALAGPVWEQQPQPMYRAASGLVIALDLSRSMDSSDIKPSRLVRAKQKLSDLLAMRKEGQTALIAFAGTAYAVTPLTEDSKTILAQLPALTTDIMPKQGGSLDAAMDKALDLFHQAGIQHGQLLFVTDSQDFSALKVNEVVDDGHEISVIGVGTLQGAPIPQADGSFVTDRKGNIVIPVLQRKQLQTLASLGHGVYRDLSLDNSDIEPILARLNASAHQQANKVVKSVVQHDSWYEEGPWLLLLLLPIAALGFRRGLLIVVLCLSVQVKPVEAGVWHDMWHTPNQQAEALMAEKKYQQAAKTFQSPAWKMAANYRNKNYQAALQDFQHIKQPSTVDLYNKGNALAHLGHLDEAISTYDEVLKKEPNNKDAKANKALLESMKKKQDKQKQDKQSQMKKQQKGKQGQSDQKKDQKTQGKQSQEQQQQQQGKDKQEQGKQDQDEQKKAKKKQGKQDQGQQQQGDEQSQAKKDQAKQQKHGQSVAQQKKASSSQPKKKKQHKLDEQDMKKFEEKQAFKQAIKRVPDDPSGLLRRKFLYQYRQQDNDVSQGNGEAW